MISFKGLNTLLKLTPEGRTKYANFLDLSNHSKRIVMNISDNIQQAHVPKKRIKKVMAVNTAAKNNKNDVSVEQAAIPAETKSPYDKTEETNESHHAKIVENRVK